jgi:carboxyl-terminal processing protease
MKLNFTKYISIALLFVGFTANGQNKRPSDFEIYKNLELFELVYKTIDVDYVDESDPGRLMKVAIDEMLKELDPYTVYIPESKIEDFKLMTTGQYGGIGALIQQQDGKVLISDPHEGYPAQKAGLYAGDIFIEIDGKNVEGLTSSEISEKLKGKPGSDVKVKVDRAGKIIEKTLTREEVKLSPVPFHDMVTEDIGYIKLTQFTQTAASNVLSSFRDLKGRNMQKLILDLRGNPGGLLIEAVKIVNMFVKKGEPIVWMKGRDNRNDVSYSASLKPEDLNMPVTVLVDKNSASASEIVSGALQDLDRAVVVGETSYGKGLVQRPLDLKYNAKIKVTIAKYYTPSGRCIQKLDYSHREVGDDAEAISDSLINRFKTRNGREVIDGRGIEPDVKVDRGVYSRLTATLVFNNIIFDFATKYRAENEKIAAAKDFKVDDALYQNFVDFVLAEEFDYTTASSEVMDELKDVVEDENFMSEAEAEYKALMEKLKPSKERDLQKFKEEIMEVLEDEIVGRYYYQKGRIAHSLDKDPFILEAIKILNDSARYKDILKIQE